MVGIISVLLKQSNKVCSRSFIGGFFIWLLLLSILSGFPVYAQYSTDNFEFKRVTNKAGKLQLSITNMGTLGNPRYGIDPYYEHPSMVYPKSTAQNHLFKGGVWLGGKVNDEIRVSTSAVTSTSGFTSIGMEGFEFFNDDKELEIIQGRERGATSDYDITAYFTDRYTTVNETSITGHTSPLYADIKMTSYSWFTEGYDNFTVLEYTITNESSELWEDVYFALFTNFNNRNVKSSLDTGSAFFNKDGAGYLEHFHSVYEFDAGSSDQPSINTYVASSVVGSFYRDWFYHPDNASYLHNHGREAPDIHYSFWQFGHGNPPDDDDRYRHMSNTGRIPEDMGNYLNTLSIGPFPFVDPGEEITIYFGLVTAKKPEEYQDLESKPVDTPDTRTHLVESLNRLFTVVRGEDMNDPDDAFQVPEYQGDRLARLEHSTVPSEFSFNAMGFDLNIYGPKPEAANSMEVCLNSEEDCVFLNDVWSRIFIRKSDDTGTALWKIQPDEPAGHFKQNMTEGENTIIISILDEANNKLDKISHTWEKISKKNDLLVINDHSSMTNDREAIINLFSENGADVWNIRFGDHPFEKRPQSDELFGLALREWKGIFWFSSNVTEAFENSPVILHEFIENGGKLFAASQWDAGDRHESLKSFYGIKELIRDQARYTIFQGAEISPVLDDFDLMPLTLESSTSSANPVRLREDMERLFEVSFNEYEDAPAIWADKDYDIIKVGLDLTLFERDEAFKAFVETVLYEMLDFESVSVVHQLSDHPDKIQLQQNYPNPFNPTTQISYSVPEQAYVRLEVYNALGQLVETLINETKSAGRYEVTFDATGLSSGIYLYRLQTESHTESRQMLLVK